MRGIIAHLVLGMLPFVAGPCRTASAKEASPTVASALGQGPPPALLTARPVVVPTGKTSEVVVAGAIQAESTYGVTILLEIRPQPGATGTVIFTPSPPVDIRQLGDPWIGQGLFSPFDTELTGLPTLNGSVDDNGSFVPGATVFSGDLAAFPISASPDAAGVWDVTLSTIAGGATWEGVVTMREDGTITVIPSSAIPAAGTWGLLTFAIVVAAAGTSLLAPRQRTPHPSNSSGLILAILCVPAVVIVLLWRRRLRTARQRRLDDALKAILTADLENRTVGAAGLAGFLGIGFDSAIRLIEQLHSSGLLRWGTGGLELTATGREAAIRLLRAHRLTERFLVDEARMAIERVHREADRAEHALTEAQLAELNEQLGHPDWDPHGDPIPDARGEVAHVDRHALDGWPLGRRAVITHVEDEPPDALRRLLAKGLRPGTVLEIASRSEDNLTVRISSRDVELSAALARQVHVRPCDLDVAATACADLNLAELESGGRARVVRLDTTCRGFTRRRLLDLGITPGAFVQVEMTNAGGSARVYRIRDTLIALRREQAGQVVIQRELPTGSEGMTAR